MTPETPDLPRVSLAEVFRVRENLFTYVAFRRLHDRADGSDVVAIRDECVRVMPRRVEPSAVLESLYRAFARVPEFSSQDWRLLVSRLAGNLDALSRGEPVSPTPSLEHAEWAPLHCVSARPDRIDGEYGVAVRWRALAGPYCGGDVRLEWRRRAWGVTLIRLGGDRAGKPLATREPRFLAGLVCWGRLVPRDRGVSISQIEVPPAMRAENRRLLKVRHRHNTPCLHARRIRCEQCELGFSFQTDSDNPRCKAALHAHTWRVAVCDECGLESAFDEDWGDRRCVACVLRAATSKGR